MKELDFSELEKRVLVKEIKPIADPHVKTVMIMYNSPED